MGPLRDPIWQFVGVVLASLAVVVSILVYRMQRQVKRIHFAVERSANLLAISTEIRHRIEVRYDGRLVQDLRVTEFTIRNSGNLPIIAADFEQPLEFFFGARSKMLSAEQISANPIELSVKLLWNHDSLESAGKNWVRLEPLLLNPGDSVGIRCLVTESDECTPKGRIAGVSTIHRAPDRNPISAA